MKREKKTVLVIAAHPDDEVLGVGGTIGWHSRMKGDDVYVLIVTEGCTTQYEKQEYMIKQKKEEAIKAGSILGVKEVFFEDLPDMRLDSLSHTRINEAIEKCVKKVQPDLVFTQHPDINKDHVLVFESTMVALRPVPGLRVKKVLSYAPASSTEWSAPFAGSYFMPNVFYDISKTLDLKLEAFDCYQSEMREFPHPRSLEAIRTYATQVGITVGVGAAEPFMLMRAIEK